MVWLWTGLGGLVGLLLLALVVWLLWRVGNSAREARALFALQRPALERGFFEAAARSGKPRGLRWKDCQWEDPVVFVRERQTSQIHALVGVTIAFEAIPGSDMEGLPAVGNLRNASAVFFFHQGQWHTTGKTVFNLNPDEALNHFRNQYERLDVTTS